MEKARIVLYKRYSNNGKKDEFDFEWIGDKNAVAFISVSILEGKYAGIIGSTFEFASALFDKFNLEQVGIDLESACMMYKRKD